MTDDGPVVDGRDAEAIARELKARAPYYVPAWDPGSADAGTALLEAFARIAGDVVERLDQAPEKHRVAFLDALGFDRLPPQPARLPATFRVSDGATENVPVPGGTQVVADVGGSERVFEIPPDGGFEATPATLRRAYSVVPDADQVFEHRSALRAGGAAGVALFDGADVQGHALYLGGGALLDLHPGAAVRISLESSLPAAALRDCLVWEYYGEEERNGETVEGWHALAIRGAEDGDGSRCRWSELRPVEEFIAALEPRLRARGYRPADHPPAVRYRLLASIAADVRARVASGGDLSDRPGSPGDGGLPRNLLSSAGDDDPADLDALLADDLRALAADLRRVTGGAGRGRRATDAEAVELDVRIPGVATAFAVAGLESRWLRCRLPREDLARGLFGLEVGNVRLTVGPGVNGDGGGHEDEREGENGDENGRSGGLVPDAAFANDVPLSLESERDLFPFGGTPQRLDSFYLASGEAFTKTGTEVEVRFQSPGTGRPEETDGAPEVSWEYWNGTNWTRLPGLRDGTAGLTGAGTVAFAVPGDLAPTGVAGREGRWIRARLVGDVRGEVSYEETGDGTWERVGVAPPRFGGVRIHYDREAPPDHLVAANNREYDATPAGPSAGRFRPFRPPPDDAQTLYLGFDGPLRDGPVRLLISVAEGRVPEGFVPRLRWEYRGRDGRDGEGWTPLAVRDGTEGLTRRGVVEFVVPGETTATRLFGDRGHWIRARVTGDAFALTAATTFVRPRRDGGAAAVGPPPLRETVRTASPAGDAVATPPVVEGLHPNTGWAYNTRTVAAEVLGSSDGTPDQAFDVSTPPAVDAEVWVDELAVLSAGRRRDLAAARPEAVETETGPGGEVRRFWVRWDRTGAFLDSGPEDRHYALDGATGRVSFGDGVRGRIPPRGRANVRATYRTGGGADGNVPAGALAGLKSSIPLVDGVTNPGAGDGGADGESTAAAVRRAPRQLRDRDRAVADGDFERIAASAARDLARVRCLPATDARGEFRPGWVTLLVVPATTRGTPTPSVELRERVRESLREQAPATLLDADRLVVRGPSYVEVGATTTLVAEPGVESVSALEEDVAAALAAFLHPLSGGPTGDGWAFGELPALSALFALLEGVDGVDHVDDLAVVVRGDGAPVRVTEGEPLPAVPPDALIRNGTHDVRVTGGV